MARLEMVDSGILYINPDPSHYYSFASHPHPLQLSESEFLCTYQDGSGLYGADMNIYLLRSSDGGQTWTHEGPLYDKSGDDRPYSYHDGQLNRLSDGTLTVLAFRADRSDPRRRMFSDTGGLITSETVLFTSGDGGHTWSGPQPIRLSRDLVATPSGGIVELADGRWMAAFDQWHGYDDPGPYEPRMWAFYSSDRGQTWGDEVVMADGKAEKKGYWHGKTIRLQDGHLYTLFWAADMRPLPERDVINLPNHYAYADAAGRRWETPQPTNLPGQTNCPAQLPDGRIAVIYTLREAERPGFMVTLSEDGGRTFDLEHQVRVWDSTGWETIGLSSPDKYPNSHDTVAFGAPTLMVTLKGELYASWWCTLASVTHLRWARLRVLDGKEVLR